MSGIHIKKENRGKFTSWASRHGFKSAHAAAMHIMSNKNNYSGAVVKMANFAKNAAKFKHPYGGTAMYAMGGDVPVEVEGGEMAETPQGQQMEFQGPSHEQGGIPTSLPQGTNIFSDRLALDGKTMADRKAARERAEKRLERISKKNPTDKLTQNTLNRTKDINSQEESKDMLLQQLANHLMTAPSKQNPQDDVQPSTSPIPDNTKATRIPAMGASSPHMAYGGKLMKYEDGGIVDPLASQQPIDTANATSPATDAGISTFGNKLGMLGTAINTVGPLINTLQNQKHTSPNINRFMNFGNDALNSNQMAMNQVMHTRDTDIDDINSDRNGRVAYNNNSASSVNTARALNIATDLESNRARSSAYNKYAGELANLYGQRGQLENDAQALKANAQTAVDTANRRDTDAFYSNMGKDIGTLGTGLQAQAKSLNEQQYNNDMLRMLPELSKYGLGFTYDANGNLVLQQLNKK